VSSAAIELAQSKHADITKAKVAILGAGKMSRLLVQHLNSKGCHDIIICNRNAEKAQELIH
jgi:glutamyl-tRNA reductase